MTQNQAPYSSQNATAGPKQLRRSRTDRKISGVCGGIAEYLDVDANLVRILVVIGTIVTGGGLALAYLVALVIMPDADAAPMWNRPANTPPSAGYQQGYPAPGYQSQPSNVWSAASDAAPSAPAAPDAPVAPDAPAAPAAPRDSGAAQDTGASKPDA